MQINQIEQVSSWNEGGAINNCFVVRAVKKEPRPLKKISLKKCIYLLLSVHSSCLFLFCFLFVCLFVCFIPFAKYPCSQISNFSLKATNRRERERERESIWLKNWNLFDRQTERLHFLTICFTALVVTSFLSPPHTVGPYREPWWRNITGPTSKDGIKTSIDTQQLFTQILVLFIKQPHLKVAHCDCDCYHFVLRSPYQWRHKQSRHMWRRCQICHEPVFFCSSSVKSQPTWYALGSSDRMVTSTSSVETVKYFFL